MFTFKMITKHLPLTCSHQHIVRNTKILIFFFMEFYNKISIKSNQIKPKIVSLTLAALSSGKTPSLILLITSIIEYVKSEWKKKKLVWIQFVTKMLDRFYHQKVWILVGKYFWLSLHFASAALVLTLKRKKRYK